MAEDRTWDRIVDAIETKFGINKHGRSTRPIEDAPELTESVAFITFTRDGIEYKLERVSGPAIIDRKTIGAKRAGATTRMQNVYDPEEIASRTDFFRQDAAGEWESITPDTLGL